MKAKVIDNAIPIIKSGDGFYGPYIAIQIVKGSAYEDIPKALEFEGRAWGLSGWSSDIGVAAYSIGKSVAIPK
jgi:hypothetical protein